MALDCFSPPPEGLRVAAADGLARRLFAAAQELERTLDDGFSGLGLNLTRADVLAFVARHGGEGCSQTDLAVALRLSESNICTLIERMRVDGWLVRLRSSVDRRKSVVILSPRGIDVIDQLIESRRHRAAAALRGLDAGQLESLNQLLDAVLQSMSQPAAAEAPALSMRRAS